MPGPSADRRVPEMGKPRSRSLRRLLGLFAALLLLAAGAAWGFLMHAREVFPYAILRNAYHTLRPHAPRQAPKKPVPHARGAPDSIQRLANLPYLQGYRSASAPPTGGISLRPVTLRWRR